MYFNRPEAKYRARLAMRGAYPHPMLVTLVYVLLTSALSYAVMYFVSNPFSLAYWYLLDGAEMEDVFFYLFTFQRVGIYLLMELLLSLYQWVMQFGYTAYALGLARRTGPGYRTLLEGFSQLGRALLVSFLTALFVFLWSLLCLLPGFVLLCVGAVVENGLLLFLSVLLLIAGLVAQTAISYRYRLATYFLLDDPHMGALAAITASKQVMSGHKWEMFVLDLSFLGWWVLSAFTLGILSLWVTPYAWASEANFYHWVVNGSFPGDQGPCVPQPGGPGEGPTYGGPTYGGPGGGESGPAAPSGGSYHSPYSQDDENRE